MASGLAGSWIHFMADYPADLVDFAIQKRYLPPEGLFFVEDKDLVAITTQTDFLG